MNQLLYTYYSQKIIQLLENTWEMLAIERWCEEKTWNITTMEKSLMQLRKCYIWFAEHATIKHKMPRDKLIKSLIVKCRLHTALHLLDCQDTAAHDGPDQLLPTHNSAQVPALPTGMLKVDQTTTRKQLNTKDTKTETKGACQVGQIPPVIWKQHTAPSWPCYKFQTKAERKKKISVSNFHLSRGHSARIGNMHFITHSSENMQEDFHKAGQFYQLCGVTHTVQLPGYSFKAETSTAQWSQASLQRTFVVTAQNRNSFYPYPSLLFPAGYWLLSVQFSGISVPLQGPPGHAVAHSRRRREFMEFVDENHLTPLQTCFPDKYRVV